MCGVWFSEEQKNAWTFILLSNSTKHEPLPGSEPGLLACKPGITTTTQFKQIRNISKEIVHFKGTSNLSTDSRGFMTENLGCSRVGVD